jgi:hypothetical protein
MIGEIIYTFIKYHHIIVASLSASTFSNVYNISDVICISNFSTDTNTWPSMAMPWNSWQPEDNDVVD